jgi:hypothetical protein
VQTAQVIYTFYTYFYRPHRTASTFTFVLVYQDYDPVDRYFMHAIIISASVVAIQLGRIHETPYLQNAFSIRKRGYSQMPAGFVLRQL